MSFFDTLSQYSTFDFAAFLPAVTPDKVGAILDKDRLTPEDFLALLSPAASAWLEPMAVRAAAVTRKQFGNVIFLFTPLYISNFCDNVCSYCSFARQHGIIRSQLSFEEIDAEASSIADTGMRNILVLTGESRKHASPGYIREAVRIIRGHFATIGIEIYPMSQEEYALLIEAGVDGLTMFQEVYNENAYRGFHCGGPKADFRFRLESPERAGACDIRSLTVGALLGLDIPQKEAFFSGLHASYLQKKFPSAEVSLSLPRLRPMVSGFVPPHPLDDRLFVQILLATRLFLPRCGITISTRESRELRNAIAALGVTKMSAGVSTAVGGHGHASVGAPVSESQFEIADARSLDEMKSDLAALGFQPVMQDWNSQFFSTPAAAPSVAPAAAPAA
jgi:2-iminoacetate synthase